MKVHTHNSTFAIGGVSCSADSLVVTESFVLRINISGKNPPPDGSKILFHNKHGIYVMDKNGDNVKRIEPNHLYNTNYTGDIKKWVANASWYPDGKYIVYEHLDITRKRTAENGLEVEGIMSFYKVNVDSALLTSKLKL